MNKLLKRIFFRTNGKPRNWLKYLIFGAGLTPRPFFNFVVINKSGQIRAAFRSWLTLAIENPAPSGTSKWTLRRQTVIDQKLLAGVRNISIIHTRQTLFVAHAIERHLLKIGLFVQPSERMPEEFLDDLYIVICPQIFNSLPPPEKRIVFQMEQSVSPRWFTPDYLNILHNSIAVFDYSLKNIEFLIKQGVSKNLLYHIPLSPIENYLSESCISKLINSDNFKKCEVLFYGDTKNKRRQSYLKVLASHFDLRIENSLFGEELWQAVIGARVVVNIHYYENALLESTRICECLSLGGFVVSEVGSDQNCYINLVDGVEFTPVDNIDAMVHVIKKKLSSENFNSNLVNNRFDIQTHEFSSSLENALQSLHVIK